MFITFPLYIYIIIYIYYKENYIYLQYIVLLYIIIIFILYILIIICIRQSFLYKSSPTLKIYFYLLQIYIYSHVSPFPLARGGRRTNHPERLLFKMNITHLLCSISPSPILSPTPSYYNRL